MSSGSYVKKLKENIKDITKCSICTETLTDARYLPCVHSFCLKCLQTYGENNKATDDSMQCPLCEKTFTLDSDGFEELPVNHFINKLINVNRISGREGHGSSSSEFCDICAENEPEKPAKGYCVDCRKQLCSACLHTHSEQEVTQSHKTVTIDQKPSSDVMMKMSENYCQTHPIQKLSLYCNDCQTTSCVTCLVTKHKGHNCSFIANSSTKLSQQIDQCAVKINDQMKQTQSTMKQIDLTLSDFEKQLKSTEDSITLKYEEMKALLASQHKRLLDQLREFRSKRLKELQTLRDESEHELLMMKSFERYWNEMKERGSACDIVQAASSLHKRADELVKQHEKQQPQRDQSSQSSYSKVEFISTWLPANYKNLLGKLCELINILPTPSCPDWRSLLQSVEAKIVCPVIRSHAISGITIHMEELFITGCATGNIEVYKLSDITKLSRLINVPSLTDATSIVSCGENNCLYVSSFSQSQIHRISLVDHTQRAWSIQGGRPWGLSISGKHHLLVSMRNTGHIEEYDTTGRYVKHIQLSGGIQEIYHAIELESGQFVVAERMPRSRIHVTDSSGTVVRTYGQSRGSSAKQLDCHIHIGVDNLGNILVADHLNNKLRVFDNTLQHLGDINTAPIELDSPWCFHWDKQNGRLLVGENIRRLVSINIANKAKFNFIKKH